MGEIPSGVIEGLAERIHWVYCEQHKKNEGKEYWSGGDYYKLEEKVKDYDRAMARFILENFTPITTPLPIHSDNIIQMPLNTPPKRIV